MFLGSIAYRERQKWLNYVEMPNNPYSPEAIQKRLSAKSTASLFDMFTKKETEDNKNELNDNNSDGRESNEPPVKDLNHNKMNSAFSNDSINEIGRTPSSPSPRLLKDIVADEIPQYKR